MAPTKQTIARNDALSKDKTSTAAGVWSPHTSSIASAPQRTPALPHLKGQPPAPDRRHYTKARSFKCSLTWRSRWRSSKPCQIAIERRRLSTTRTPFASRRRWSNSTIKSMVFRYYLVFKKRWWSKKIQSNWRKKRLEKKVDQEVLFVRRQVL